LGDRVLRIDVVTIFPRLVQDFAREGLLGRALSAGLLELHAHDLRRWSRDRHRSVDDEPYGGGAGMVMTPAPFFDAVDELGTPESHVVLLSPRGARLNQAAIEQLATRDHLILLCGRYEGVDERVSELVDQEISIGDYVLAGGELPALVVVEAIGRLIPGALGNPSSLETESHARGLLEHPQYTRPADYRGLRVPDVLLSGDHGAVAAWREQQARRITSERRPDLRDR
jgi:tRNA (guanine37-N1)-methyltransferase